MRLVVLALIGCAAFSGCAVPKEKLAKCSADENPVGLAALSGTEAKRPRPFAAFNDCGPMKPVNSF